MRGKGNGIWIPLWSVFRSSTVIYLEKQRIMEPCHFFIHYSITSFTRLTLLLAHLFLLSLSSISPPSLLFVFSCSIPSHLACRISSALTLSSRLLHLLFRCLAVILLRHRRIWPAEQVVPPVFVSSLLFSFLFPFRETGFAFVLIHQPAFTHLSFT